MAGHACHYSTPCEELVEAHTSPILSLPGLHDLLLALEPELSAIGGLAPLFAGELINALQRALKD